MRFTRASGVLLHVTSLPSPFGIGDLGAGAIDFIDFLENAGQSVWQVLPLGPPAHGNSPYSCISAFAGNPLLISPDQMAIDGWLDLSKLGKLDFAETNVDFDTVTSFKKELLHRAFEQSRAILCHHDSYAAFCHKNSWWLTDVARFEALMNHFDEADWTQWPIELVKRDKAGLDDWDNRLADSIERSKFFQFVFDQQWQRIKSHANDRGIRIFGDMPIFVAHESADVWANQNLFSLNEAGQCTFVAGVPPDYFSETGQLWGNPLYRWDVLESTGFAWWTSRFEFAFQQFDLLRVDHFRGFESYWEIPADAETALPGRWRDGPSEKPFDAARERLGELPIVAEDLGLITQEVHQLRNRLGFPAMRVMQFGFDDPNDLFHHPDHYPKHSVAYTGTHDNDTLMGWYADRRRQQPENHLLDSVIDGTDDIHFQLIQAVLDSASDTAILPMQDLLGLGNQARMNLPGEADGNWGWRVRSSDLVAPLADRLRRMTEAANRCRSDPSPTEP